MSGCYTMESCYLGKLRHKHSQSYIFVTSGLIELQETEISRIDPKRASMDIKTARERNVEEELC